MRFILDMTIADSIIIERVQLQTRNQVDQLIIALNMTKKQLWPWVSDESSEASKKK